MNLYAATFYGCRINVHTGLRAVDPAWHNAFLEGESEDQVIADFNEKYGSRFTGIRVAKMKTISENGT